MQKQQFETEVSWGAKPFISWSGSKTEEKKGLESLCLLQEVGPNNLELSYWDPLLKTSLTYQFFFLGSGGAGL